MSHIFEQNIVVTLMKCALNKNLDVSSIIFFFPLLLVSDTFRLSLSPPLSLSLSLSLSFSLSLYFSSQTHSNFPIINTNKLEKDKFSLNISQNLGRLIRMNFYSAQLKLLPRHWPKYGPWWWSSDHRDCLLPHPWIYWGPDLSKFPPSIPSPPRGSNQKTCVS